MSESIVRLTPKLDDVVFKPWGYYKNLFIGPNYQVKKIVVNPGGKLSLQLHHHRSENWVVIQGIAQVICGQQNIELQMNEHIYIPKETKHRLWNLENFPLIVIETQTGDFLSEDDIVRFEDAYHRNTV